MLQVGMQYGSVLLSIQYAACEITYICKIDANFISSSALNDTGKNIRRFLSCLNV